MGAFVPARMCSRRWRWARRASISAGPFLYGLGARGQGGVTTCLEIIRNELDITMAFCGHRDIAEVDRGILLPGTY
jgi:L-lactate dehydrogenase (cytochrome)